MKETVRAAIITIKEETPELLVHTKSGVKAYGRKEIVGGKIEKRSRIDAIKDEIHEETGLIIPIRRLWLLGEHEYQPDNLVKNKSNRVHVTTWWTTIDSNEAHNIRLSRIKKADGSSEDNHQKFEWLDGKTIRRIIEQDPNIFLPNTNLPEILKLLDQL